ncbi:MAG TPA: ABC transporter ATP-binding protein [Gemmataceae bacterium]|jgi:ABC-2 type transport system ATP-binding protein
MTDVSRVVTKKNRIAHAAQWLERFGSHPPAPLRARLGLLIEAAFIWYHGGTIRIQEGPSMTAAFLEVREVNKSYGPTLALDRVSFDVQAGEVFGLLGPNGAGKTTLLSIMSCLLEPTSGEVRLLGTPVAAKDREVRRLIGIVPQELALYDDLTARENLCFFGELFGIDGAELRQRVAHILAAIGLEDRAADRVRTFSGGMKRRLNLGVALVHRPRLLLLDEPTVGVDPQSRNHIFEEVRRLNAEGMTIVYTSHYMEEVQALCSRIGIIDRGKLAACDTLLRLLQTLPGAIRFRVSPMTPGLRERLKELPDALLCEQENRLLELECGDVKLALVELMRLLQHEGAELVHLEIEEPNLERVFLHLTGRQLRD